MRKITTAACGLAALGVALAIGSTMADADTNLGYGAPAPASELTGANPVKLDTERLIHYLVDSAPTLPGYGKNTGGKSLSYIATTGGSASYPTALSYAVAPEYFAYYVCQIAENGVKNDCHVDNVWNSAAGVLATTETAQGFGLQLERLNMTHGAVIYDMAAWQIAVALHGQRTGNTQYITIADAFTHYLADGQFSHEPSGSEGQNRAITHDNGLPSYQGVAIKEPQEAYTFRMVPTSWKLKDPFAMMTPDTQLREYVTFDAPPDQAWTAGDLTWQDWKGITGENAWAQLVGPLQTDYLKYMHEHPNTPVDKVLFQDVTLNNATKVLHAIALLQSEIGGIYYAPEGTLGNTGSIVDPYEVAIENNASMMAGLLLLEQALVNTVTHKPGSGMQKHLDMVREILYGRDADRGEYKKTDGLLPFFMNVAWDAESNRFYTHGYANSPNYPETWHVNPQVVNAVDANSWTIATLGPEFLDKHLKGATHGTTYKIWEELQKWGVYKDQSGKLMGVGFDDSQGANQTIMSAEWTLGAIGMLRSMSEHYDQHSGTLNTAISDMKAGLEHLTTDYYPHSPVFANDVPKAIGKDLSYHEMVVPQMDKQKSQGLVYASKRYFIPFGWYANAVPSTASTAWAVMENYGYNPFAFGGHFNGVTVDPYGGHFKPVAPADAAVPVSPVK